MLYNTKSLELFRYLGIIVYLLGDFTDFAPSSSIATLVYIRNGRQNKFYKFDTLPIPTSSALITKPC